MTYRFNPFTGKLDRVDRSPWVNVSDSIAATSSKTVDTFASSAFESLKYMITVFNTDNTDYKTLELSVLNNNGNYKESVSGRLRGGPLSIDVDTNNNAGTFELVITNNNTYEVEVRLSRLLLV